MIKKTKGSEQHLKNACAVSNFVHVLLTKGYHFNNLSFPSISFEKTVRNDGNNIFYVFIIVLD